MDLTSYYYLLKKCLGCDAEVFVRLWKKWDPLAVNIVNYYHSVLWKEFQTNRFSWTKCKLRDLSFVLNFIQQELSVIFL